MIKETAGQDRKKSAKFCRPVSILFNTLIKKVTVKGHVALNMRDWNNTQA
jgi:hypothetical protein